MYKIVITFFLLLAINSVYAQPDYTVTSAADTGPGTLSDAIQQASTATGLGRPYVINFAGSVPVGSILSGAGLISSPVIIDGTSHPSYNGSPVLALLSSVSPGSGLLGTVSFVEGAENSILKGFNCPAVGSTCSYVQVLKNIMNSVVLTNCSTVTIKGNSITGYREGINMSNTNNIIIDSNIISKNQYKGIWLNGNNTNFLITNNKIGTDVTGTVAAGQQLDGILVDGLVSGVISKNLISGNIYNGMYFDNTATGSLSIIQNNIGTDITGGVAIPNGYGIFMDYPSPGTSMITTIGGAGMGNVISGNTYDGIFSHISNVTIKGNIIGLNSKGSQPLPNRYGIFLQGMNNAQIGGSQAGEGNTVSGNNTRDASDGIFVNYPGGIFVQSCSNFSIIGNKIGTDVTGTIAIPNINGIFIQYVDDSTAIANNVISGNTDYGVQLSYSNNIILTGNNIGVNAAGTAAIGNGLDGINLYDANEVVIGGTSNGSGNIISGNKNGITLYNYSENNTIQGNLIGCDYTGTKIIPNINNGVYVSTGSSNNNIGGITGQGNIIGGNLGCGILLDGGAAFAYIRNNSIGVSSAGKLLSNNQSGISIRAGTGSITIDSNTIAGNGQRGIELLNSGGGEGSTGVTITNNYIGTNKTYANIGNVQQGIMITGATVGNLINNNIIGNNGQEGIFIYNMQYGNQISGNYIGTTPTKGLLSNQADGIKLLQSSNNVIGVSENIQIGPIGGILGNIPGATYNQNGNVIAYNKKNGIFVDSGSQNIISGNVIYDNGSSTYKSINLNFGDANSQSAGNNGKAKPIFISVTLSAGNYIISGTTTAGQDGIQFFQGDVSGRNALQYLSGYDIRVNSTSWTQTIPTSLLPGGYVVATATDVNGNTSELSAYINILNPPPPNCSECVSTFSPQPGQKYLLSAWVREDYTNPPFTYTNSGILISFNDSTIILPVIMASGPIIEGWQRIEKSFLVPSTAYNIQLNLMNISSSGTPVNVYFDDIRVHPFRSNMKSYVYDPSTQRLTAELDENNYATRYEYDDEGILIRVKKETERGVMTIKETRNNQSKINTRQP